MNGDAAGQCGGGGCDNETGWKAGLRAVVVSQFGRPRGVLGRLAGAIMARRRSNVERSLWTVSLLDLRPGDRVLEIGFGPGVALAEACRRVGHGAVVGIDHSQTMLRQAARRNRRAVQEGRLRLVLGSVETLDPGEGPFDKIFAVNSIAFWPRPVMTLRMLHERLQPGGTIAITEQPRSRGADESATRAAGRRIARQLEAAGFDRPRAETLPLAVPAVCVLGHRA
jgi:SAM-dependent methyltransferase